MGNASNAMPSLLKKTLRENAWGVAKEPDVGGPDRAVVAGPLEELRAAMPPAGSGPVHRRFRQAKPVDDSFELRSAAENHVLHGSVVPLDGRVKFLLGDQPQRSGNRFLEALPCLPEGDEIVRADRV